MYTDKYEFLMQDENIFNNNSELAFGPLFFSCYIWRSYRVSITEEVGQTKFYLFVK